MKKIIKEIYEGWTNHLFSDDEYINRMSEARLHICDICPKHSKFHETPLRFDDHCTDCGCTLVAKTKCLSCECPIGKWKAVNDIKNGREDNNT